MRVTTTNTSNHFDINSEYSTITSFVVHEDRVYFSKSTLFPIGELLEFIWTDEPKWARSITRNRIYTRIKPSPLCQGMIKVVGKRYTFLSEDDFFNLFLEQINRKKPTPSQISNQNWPYPLAYFPPILTVSEGIQLAKEISKNSLNKIGAILLDENMKLVSWGWNDHHSNRIIHAEIMLVKNYRFNYGKLIPKNFKLITTLLPCAMCAGYLHGYCEDFHSLEVFYINDDRGPFAQNSILFQNSSLYKSSGMQKTAKLIKFSDYEKID